MTFYSKWNDAGHKARCAPNPAFPDGMDCDASMGAAKTCETSLPYPAKGCGHFIVGCPDCGMTVAITAAGRPDDPRSIKIACKRQ